MKKVTTPIATAVWPKLSTPDTKFDPIGYYKVDIAFDTSNEEHQKFLAELEEYAQSAIKELMNEVPKPKQKTVSQRPIAEDEYNGEEPTGRVLLRTKQRARIETKAGDLVDMRPVVVDAKNKKIPASVIVGGGSKIRAGLELRPYYVPASNILGVSVRLRAVQVVELATSERVADGFAFKEEAGFEFDESSAPEASEEEEDLEEF